MKKVKGLRFDASSNAFYVNDRRIKGNFDLEPSNTLAFRLNEDPAVRQQLSLPEKVVFSGLWELNSDNDLVYVLKDYDKTIFKDAKIVFETSYIRAGAEHLVCSITARHAADGGQTIRLVKLKGVWGTDKNNNLVFDLYRDAEKDLLTFSGTWHFGRNQLKYMFHDNDKHDVAFSGTWEILGKNRIAYLIKGVTDASLIFNAELQSLSLAPQKGAIKYLIGVGAKRSKAHKELIIDLHGTLKLGKAGSVTFELDHIEDKNKLKFSLGKALADKTKVSCELLAENGEFSGISMDLTKKFLSGLNLNIKAGWTPEEARVFLKGSVQF
jgi:hypothetical protein